MIDHHNLIGLIKDSDDIKHFKELNWKGSFQDYLKLFQSEPRIARSAFQRCYDMILSHGTEEYKEHKKKILRYKLSSISSLKHIVSVRSSLPAAEQQYHQPFLVNRSRSIRFSRSSSERTIFSIRG